MHIPDGFVNTPVAVASGLLAAGGVGLAIHHARQSFPPSRVPLLGLSAAFIFAAQMLNFPVAGGTSGHLLGATLAAILLGPAGGIVAMTAVVIVQSLMFADGGITAMGANLFNMAILSVIGGSVTYHLLLRITGRNHTVSAAVAGWCSVMLAAASCSGQIALSGHAKPALILSAMLWTHALIGIGEGLITAMVVAGIARTHVHLLQPTAPAPAARSSVWLAAALGLIVSLGLAIFVSPFACPWPDGLERVAEQLGFDTAAMEEPILAGLFGDYQVSSIANPTLSTAAAGAIGTLVMLGIGTLLAVALVLARPRAAAPVRPTPEGP